MNHKHMSTKSASFAKGGGNKMAPQTGAAPVIAGQVSSGGRSGDNTFKAKASKTGVMGKQGGAAAAVAGGVSSGGRAGSNSFSVKAGGKAMAGFTGATPAKPL